MATAPFPQALQPRVAYLEPMGYYLPSIKAGKLGIVLSAVKVAELTAGQLWRFGAISHTT